MVFVQDYAPMVAQLRHNFVSGRMRPVAERIKMLKALDAMIANNRPAFEEALNKDISRHKLEAWCYELLYVQNEINYCLDNIHKWTAPQSVDKTVLFLPDTPYIHNEGKGVVLIIGAWNYPIQLLLAPLVGALAAGNCAVLKPSEVSSHTAAVLTRLLPEYLDQDVIRVVNGGVPETTALLQVKFDHIMFTGNEAVGKIVYQAAAKNLTPVTLELGGKCPAIVDKNIDVDTAGKRIAWGKYVSCGQTCLAPDYVLVMAEVYDEFVEAVKKHTTEMYSADPQHDDAYARIISSRHFDRLKKIMSETSGQLIWGGKQDENDLYIQPGLVELPLNKADNDSLMQEEIFGPIMPVIKIKSIDEAIDYLSNRSDTPLAMYIFTKDKNVIKRIVHNNQAGGVTVNDCILHCALGSLPFGGVGSSGIGKCHGKASFDTFSNPKAVLERSFFGEFMLWMRYPPFDEAKFRWARMLAPYRPLPTVDQTNNAKWFIIGILFACLIKLVIDMF